MDDQRLVKKCFKERLDEGSKTYSGRLRTEYLIRNGLSQEEMEQLRGMREDEDVCKILVERDREI